MNRSSATSASSSASKASSFKGKRGGTKEGNSRPSSKGTRGTHDKSSSKKPALKGKQRGTHDKASFKKKGGTAPTFKRKRGIHEIVFDPEARREHLRGFSERKKQRRAYGLAMQKLKDRDAKLELRRENKKAQEEELKQLEQQKEAELMPDDDDDDDNENHPNDDDAEGDQNVLLRQAASTVLTKYEDVQTTKQWGGQVIVTTSTLPVDDDEEEEDDDEDDEDQEDSKPPARRPQQQQHEPHSIDKQQKYAGSLNKYLHQVKSNMPGKKKKQTQQQPLQHRKGRHGATAMKGMGGAPTLKLAQKALSKASVKAKPLGKAASVGAKHSKKRGKR